MPKKIQISRVTRKQLILSIYLILSVILFLLIPGKINTLMILLFFFSYACLIISIKFNVRQIYMFIMIAISMVGILFSTIFILMIGYGESMIPTIKDRNLILVYQNSFESRNNDLVVIELDHDDVRDYKHIFKRIVASPGDPFTLNGNRITLNQMEFLLTERVYFEFLELISQDLTKLPDDFFFVVGDNVELSYDSRYFGLVRKNQIVGKVIIIF